MPTTSSPRLLVVDDEQLNRDVLRSALGRAGYDVVTTDGGAAALDLLASRPVDLVLLDVMMPVVSGFDVLRQLRATPRPVHLPVIMVTALSESRDIVQALELGADDYITKPIDLPVVLARVKTQLGRSATEARLASRADRLTGLPSRSRFLEHLAEVGPAAGSTSALLLIGIDHFGDLRQSLPPDCTERALCLVADRLAEGVRSADPVAQVASRGEPACCEFDPGGTDRPLSGLEDLARVAQDQFAVLLTGLVRLSDAHKASTRLIRHLRRPIAVGGDSVVISVSVGIAPGPAPDGDGKAWLGNAETALHEARRQGDGGTAWFDEQTRNIIRRRFALLSELRTAIAENQFALHYQPIVELATGRIAEAEALVRWVHPRRGLVSPAEFIPLAEETGLIVPLGDLLFRQACRQMRAWDDAGGVLAGLCVNVNLSARQLLNPSLVDDMLGTLAEAGIAASRIELEITESAVMVDPEQAAAVFERLRQAGFRLALDDFGTGHSSMAWLLKFGVHRLKVDRSFLQQGGQPLLESMVALAHRLGLSALVEGIENETHIEQLQHLDCDFGQGFHFSRPVDPVQLEKHLADVRQGAVA
jgi:EAL domain-containing protein (putative c-di-GMP-specific phosphodiesterase class I)/CheY-like chemotaxis protein